MRIEYNILWVEDEKSWYDTTKQLFSDTLEDLGFKLISKRCINLEQVKQEIAKNNLVDYDLLLVDFSLRGSESGDKIIEFIRSFKDQPILTDVLFYSSAVDNVRTSMHVYGLEGVYTADRKEIETKFEQVVTTTIKKIQEVNTMRGLIMAETSDLDEIMLEITSILIKTDISPQFSEYIESEMIKTVDFISELAKNSENHISQKILDGRIFTSVHKAKAINKLYKLKQIGVDGFFESYNKDVLSTRNVFAHVKEITVDGVKVLKSKVGKEEIFDESRCIEIRKNLIKHREILEQIRLQIISN